MSQSPASLTVVRLMAEEPRGPRRDGLFAVWLTLRVVEDLSLDPPHAERAIRRRVSLLERRLTSLALPAPLRRGLTGVLGALSEPARRDPSALLALLGASARDGLGAEVGERLARSFKDA